MRGRGKPIPDDARAALLAWQPGNGTLNALARKLGVNPSSARTLRSRVGKQQCRRREGLGDGNEARRPDRCGVTVLRSPNDQFPIGNKFPMIDLPFMVRYSGMPDETAFEITPRGGQPYVVEMQDGELVRSAQ